MGLNEQEKIQKSKQLIKNTKLLPLLNSREQALQKKKHPYEFLKMNGYMKSPIEEFY